MTLQSSGSISLQNIATEFGGSAPHNISEYYGAAAGIPSSGTISFSNFYGASSFIARGYAMGGDFGSDFDNIHNDKTYKFPFNTHTVSQISNAISVGSVAYAAGCGYGSTKGFSMGGFASSSSIIFGLTYASEVHATIAATLALARAQMDATNSSDRGYAMGGISGSTRRNEIDGIIFASEAANNPAAALAVARYGGAGTSSSTKGYFMGGYTTGFSSEIDGITFSSEAANNPTATLSLARYDGAGVNSSTHGYVLGGSGSAGWRTDIDGIVFATDTAHNPSSTIVYTTAGGGGMNDSTDGYIFTSYVSAPSGGIIQRFNFSTETASNTSGVAPSFVDVDLTYYGPYQAACCSAGYL